MMYGSRAEMAAAVPSRAAEVMPAPPQRYFNDYTLTVSGPVVEELNQQLADFERQTSNQILVAVFRKAELFAQARFRTARPSRSSTRSSRRSSRRMTSTVVCATASTR